MSLLEGRRGLVFGVANRRSIAWAIAQALAGEGAQLAFTFQGERIEQGVRDLAATVNSPLVVSADVTRDEDLDSVFEAVDKTWGGLDILVHSVAFAPPQTFEQPFAATRRADFLTALDISAFSLIAMTNRAAPLMDKAGGGAVLTMTFNASQRTYPNYNIMAVAKAALETEVRYLANELGPRNIRVNAISAGPVRTLAARSITGFTVMEEHTERNAPLRRNISAEDVGHAALYLCSPLSANVTGHILMVDAGYSTLGMSVSEGGAFHMELPLTPMEFARRARRLYGDREGVIDGDLRLSYAQFFDRCDRWSQVLQQQLGVGHGDRVAYIAPNTHAQLESFYAVPQLGAVLVPINFRLTADDFAYIIGHSGARVVCAHSDYLDAVDGIRDQIPDVEHFVALEGGPRDGWLDYEALVSAATPEFLKPNIDESDLLSINYTSGTTSRPKGVMITHRNAYMNVVGTLCHIPMTPADTYLWTLPMFHANGWTYTWVATAAGAKHVCLRRVEPPRVFELIRQEHATMLCAAPTVLISLANCPDQARGEVRTGVRVVTAGAPPAAATINRIEMDFGWEITHVYGLTETAPFITICEPRPEHAKLPPEERAIVKARQGVELMTSGELTVIDDDGREVPWDGDTLGEIVVRGNVVMKGYYNDPEATAKAFEGGWFHSGDGAVIQPDGYVEIRDRMKDVIISGGENISSIEVEGVLLRHSAVQEAAVVGLPDEKWGEAPHAFVILKPGASATEDELRQFTRDRLAHFKAPHSVKFVDELPKTATGKIQKYVLRGGRAAIAAQ